MWKRADKVDLHTGQYSLIHPSTLLILHPGYTHRDLARDYKISYKTIKGDHTAARDEVLQKFAELGLCDGVREHWSDIITELVLFGRRCSYLTQPHSYRLNVR
jgi:hypothetical protein